MHAVALTLWPPPAEDRTWSPPMKPPQVASFTRTVWLLLAVEGGRWSSGEIYDKLRPAGWSRKNAARYIADMAYSGLLKRYPAANDESRVSYGVTRDCKTPRGLEVKDFEAMLGIRFVSEAACARDSTA